MSLSNVYSTLFADMFEIDYQGRSRLRGTVTEMHGLKGSSFKGKVIESVAMGQHGAYGADIPATPVTVSAPTANFLDFELKLALDRFDSLNINADILKPYSMSIAESIGRQEDQYIIDAADAGAGSTVAVDVSGAATNLSFRKLREARKALGQYEIGIEDDLVWVTHANNLQALLAETEVGSWEYNSVRALQTGELEKFMGFTFKVLGDRTCDSTISGNTGGLPKSGNNRTNYVYSKRAILLGYRMDPEVHLTYLDNQLRYETLGAMSAGAVAQLSKGVVKVLCDETKD